MSLSQPKVEFSGKDLNSFCPPAAIFVAPNGDRYSDKYADASAAWVMAASILIFFMKAGFLFLEVAFVSDDLQVRRRVILAKYLDTCASAVGFYLFGYGVSGSADKPYLGESKDYIEWFFRFTFASNTATILHGTLVGHKRKLRMISLFIYAFLVSAFIHPFLAREMWSSVGHFSPYRFCNGTLNKEKAVFEYIQTFPGHDSDIFFLDYAGSGAVHMLGGFGGLVLALLCKFVERKTKTKKSKTERMPSKYTVSEDFRPDVSSSGSVALNTSSGGSFSSVSYHPGKAKTSHRKETTQAENSGEDADRSASATFTAIKITEEEQPVDAASDSEDESDFIESMYPKESSAEFLEFAALGVLILWTTFFAFNCGTTESASGQVHHAILGRIALNMVVAGGFAGIVATMVALFAQLRHRSRYINTNEIANGILGSLVAITGCCPYIPAERAIVVGIGAVLFYHLGAHAEFRWKIPDTARVFPVHGMCGIWGLLCVGILGTPNLIRETHENVCSCREIPLPNTVDSQGWVFLYQIVAVLFIIAWSMGSCGFIFLILLMIPMQPVADGVDAIIHFIDQWITPCLTVLVACSKPRRKKLPKKVRNRQLQTSTSSYTQAIPKTRYEDEFIFDGGMLFTSPEEYGGRLIDHYD